MAYNRLNKLELIIKIQDITKEHIQRGVSQQWVFDNIIKPTWPISQRTFYTYLGTQSPRRELKKIKTIQEAQMQLF